MESLFIYFLKSSGLIAVFYLAYYFLLRKETFFNSNRCFLLSGLITSALLPLVVFTKTVWVEPSTDTFDWSNFHTGTTTSNSIKIATTNAIQNNSFEINWHLVFGIIYVIAILIFLVKFAFDFYSLSKVLKGKTIQKHARFKFVDVTENIAPFSYFNTIVYNSSLYSTAELENILEHEKIHSDQNHTFDVLFSRLFCIVFWFNPLVWLYKKTIIQNLEFIADSEASKIISDKKAYQLTLLKITTQENCVAFTNHFYQSLIKKRIVMLNKNQSNKRNSWKYTAVLPFLSAFIFFFQVKVVAQQKVTSLEKKESKSDIVEIKNDSNLLSINKEKNAIVKKDIKKMDLSIVHKPVKITAKKEKPIASYHKDYYINGLKSTVEEYSKLDLNSIDKVEANPFERQVRVTTIKSGPLKTTIDNEEEVEKKGENVALITLDDGTPPFYYDYDKALVILDGKESDYKTVLKNKDKELKFVYATHFTHTPDQNKKIVLATYGDKARNGVFVVETNTYYRKK